MKKRTGIKAGLTDEQLRVLDLTRRAFIRSGAQLKPEQKVRLADIIARLASLGTQFSQNVLQDETSFTLALDNEDLGKSFYEILTNTSGHTLIDFQNFKINTLHVVTELPCINGDEEFRPDITLLVNGLPLVFIEVKKPNNLDGIGRRCGYLNAKSCRCKNDMKLWKLVDKKIGFIAYLSTWDYAQILAKRLFLIEFDISQVEIEEKE